MVNLKTVKMDPNPWKNDKHFEILSFDTCTIGPASRELYKLLKINFDDTTQSVKLTPLNNNLLVLIYVSLRMAIDKEYSLFKINNWVVSTPLTTQHLDIDNDLIDEKIIELFLKSSCPLYTIEIFYNDIRWYHHQKCLHWYYTSVYYPDDFLINFGLDKWSKL